MPARVDIPIPELINLIEEHRGNVAKIGRVIKHHRHTVQARIDESAQAARALGDARETRVDDAIDALYDEAIDKRNITALIFRLKADPVAKRRGWGERQEVSGPDGGPVAVDHTHHMAEVSDDDLRRNLAAFGRAALAASGRAPVSEYQGGAEGDDPTVEEE